MGLKIVGIMIKVVPEYAIIIGRDANNGIISLYLHLRSTTSSQKPNSTMKHTENAAALY